MLVAQRAAGALKQAKSGPEWGIFVTNYRMLAVVFGKKSVTIHAATFYPGSCQKCSSKFSPVNYLARFVTRFIF